ncbi:unnamed protein product [Musa acuminata var. zebrina]
MKLERSDTNVNSAENTAIILIPVSPDAVSKSHYATLKVHRCKEKLMMRPRFIVPQYTTQYGRYIPIR